MKLKRVKYKTYQQLKEIGFDIINCTCSGYPECMCTTFQLPEQALVQMWLREEYGIDVCILKLNKKSWIIKIFTNYNRFAINAVRESYNNYEQALEEAILECIKLIKTK